MKNVLFVCLGNICRSPLAEAIFNDKIDKKGLKDKYQADSCGTAAYHIGESPDPRTIKMANSKSIPISHIGRQLSSEDLERFDIVLVMDNNNYDDTLYVNSNHTSKVYKMREFDSELKGSDVPDPWHGGQEGFEEVYRILNRSVEGLIDHLESGS